MLKMYAPEDFDACLDIYVDAFTAPPLNYDWLTREKSFRYIRDLTITPGFMGYTYWRDDRIVAFCFGVLDNYFEGTMFSVEELAVRSEFHNSGIGTEVMNSLETKLAGYAVAAITLQTSRKLPAYKFYLKNEYEEMEENVSLMKWLQ